jgi:hypothetical protein
MEINLSWDLFVIVFFTVIIAYSFIVGRNSTLKIIIASYIAILASDGIGNLIERFLIGDKPLVNILQLSTTESSIIVTKIFIFVFTIVLITTRGRFAINMGKTGSPMMNAILNLTYGVLSAGLITSTILIYASGASLVQETNIIMNEAVLGMYRSSYMVQIMINNYNVWFSLPAITFVLSSFIGGEEA